MEQRLHGRDYRQTLGELAAALFADGKAWFAAELALFRAEAKQSLNHIQLALIFGVAGAIVALAGFLVLAATLVIVLAPFTGPGLAGLIVGVVLIGLATALLLVARRLLDPSRLLPTSFKGLKSESLE